MRDYPNMSYCQCQNTLAALEQVLHNMDEESREFLPDLSRDERYAFDMLVAVCAQFARRAERMIDNEEVDTEQE
jgi:hypothetical protein